MGIYVSRRIKFFFSQGIISVFRRQQGKRLTITSCLDLKSRRWKLLGILLQQINMSFLMPRIEHPEATPRQESPLWYPHFPRCLLITGPRVEESSRSFGETVERSYGRNTNLITSHRNLHRRDLALNRLALPIAYTSPE